MGRTIKIGIAKIEIEPRKGNKLYISVDAETAEKGSGINGNECGVTEVFLHELFTQFPKIKGIFYENETRIMNEKAIEINQRFIDIFQESLGSVLFFGFIEWVLFWSRKMIERDGIPCLIWS